MNRWVRRGILVLFWMAIGTILASVLGFVLGSAETATIAFVIALLVATTVVPTALVLGIVSKLGAGSGLRRGGPLGAPPMLAPTAPREIARIESLREAGLTVRNFHHLYEFTVTVFPRAGSPRREVFSQLITMGELPGFFTGRYVVVATTTPGAPPVLDPAPDPHWAAELRAAPSRYDAVAPPAGAATAPSTARAKGPSSAEAPRAGGLVGRILANAVIIALCLAGGFALGTVWVFSTPQRAAALIGEVPQRLGGQVQGVWDSAVLDLDLADLRRQLHGRSLESVVLFDTYWSIDAMSATDPEGEDSYSYRNGSLNLSWTSELISSQGGFSIDEVDPVVVRRVVATVRGDHPGIAISDVMIRRLQGPIVIDVDSDGVYKTTTRRFDAKTGAEIPVG
ncbi:hypothetical protein [Microbacterium sp. 13-71-7]|jgi:hypothetical protein|uniref:hypothetical protein n=1 Tax=Microbacterium sp. 13-71-7 TaxID=1970399 RepID=UPI000BD74D97|nr:hypothetical protein [Microbacterium sp. 13-71-7]OZB82056.1 MAG: hypothetical protein B7X32_14845 [Microbacterium sp. 13-71-7]